VDRLFLARSQLVQLLFFASQIELSPTGSLGVGLGRS